jgi:hypothetical protein
MRSAEIGADPDRDAMLDHLNELGAWYENAVGWS